MEIAGSDTKDTDGALASLLSDLLGLVVDGQSPASFLVLLPLMTMLIPLAFPDPWI